MIRRALVRDTAVVHRVLLAAKDDIPLAQNFADRTHEDWIRNECRNRNVWVDERAGQAAGVLVMHVTEIFYLVTSETFRKQGVASGLIDHAISLVDRHYSSGITARVREQNLQIVSLLEKKGFYKHPVLAATRPGWVLYAFGRLE